ncbi:MAG TPA: DUF2911 domain-containing protein [Candidatus Dormibacteraeota bacterium]|nr:DUF2911 domain-containing protein [Candidatus Dormibacteraeota bacterium]
MFKNLLVAVLAMACLLTGSPDSSAQNMLDLPLSSQQARVMQRIGLTYITINYHRPLVKGRKIFGGLEAYGKVWRAGANENTTIEFSDPVSIAGKLLPSGTYGLFMIPGESEWTVILSKNFTSWGAYTYNPAEDALRVTVKPQTSEFHEALTYEFDDLKPDATAVTLRWDKLAVGFKVAVNLRELVPVSLKTQLRGWSRWNYEGWDEAARYLLENNGNLQDALKFEEGSLNVEERGDTLLTKSTILDKLGRKEEAKAARERAMKLATAVQLHNYARGLQLNGQREQAREIFRLNITAHPSEWVVHNGAARVAAAQGDFPTAVAEMKLAIAGAPPESKRAQEALLKRLEAKEDINEQ